MQIFDFFFYETILSYEPSLLYPILQKTDVPVFLHHQNAYHSNRKVYLFSFHYFSFKIACKQSCITQEEKDDRLHSTSNFQPFTILK